MKTPAHQIDWDAHLQKLDNSMNDVINKCLPSVVKGEPGEEGDGDLSDLDDKSLKLAKCLQHMVANEGRMTRTEGKKTQYDQNCAMFIRTMKDDPAFQTGLKECKNYKAMAEFRLKYASMKLKNIVQTKTKSETSFDLA